jgi:hypothetical protein
MKLGEIYYFVSDQAVSYVARQKYHIYICETGWLGEGSAFLFISKSDYGGDYQIKRADYPFLTYDVSYVSCGSMVSYPEDYLAKAAMKKIGVLRSEHLSGVYGRVRDSFTMEQRLIKLICGALAPFATIGSGPE